MTHADAAAPAGASNDLPTLPPAPAWVTALRVQAPDDVAFLSGAALSHLHLLLARPEVPQALLRERLALRAAAACVARAGRPERAAELRDALAFRRPGDAAGPAGEVYEAWRRAVARPVSVATLHRAMPAFEAAELAAWLDAGQGGPVARAAGILAAVLAARPRAGDAALRLADAGLAQALGWCHVVPLLGQGLRRGDLRAAGAELARACHAAVARAAVEAAREAADLARRAARLRAVAPGLRAKGAAAAVELLLAQDALAAADLAALRSDRAARRFCDRLVALGAARELTGRATFRLYGL